MLKDHRIDWPLTVIEVVVEPADAASEERVDAVAVPRRREHAVGERIGQRGADRQADVVARDDVGRLREARLIDAADVEQRRHGIDRIAAAQHRLLVDLVREADTRLEVVHVRVVGPALAVGREH